jgi:hypothetical protein
MLCQLKTTFALNYKIKLFGRCTWTLEELWSHLSKSGCKWNNSAVIALFWGGRFCHRVCTAVNNHLDLVYTITTYNIQPSLKLSSSVSPSVCCCKLQPRISRAGHLGIDIEQQSINEWMSGTLVPQLSVLYHFKVNLENLFITKKCELF